MTHRTRPPRTRALTAAGAALAIVLAGCSSASTGATSPASSTASGHAGHDTTGAPAPTEPLREGERFVDMSMSAAYQPAPPNGGTDEYRCLLLDPKITEPAFLTGTRFQPGNEPIVHHALVFAVPPEGAQEATAKDAETPGDGWTCFGDSGLRGGDKPPVWVDTWTPNGTETLLPQDVGFPIAPGGLIVLQIHYNLLATDGKPGQTDRSTVRLRMKTGTAATKPLDTAPLDVPIELPCATDESGPLCDRATAVADVAKRFGEEVGGTEDRLVEQCSGGVPKPGNTQSCEIRAPRNLTIYAALGHMHLLGRAIKIELNADTPAARTLLDVPMFDFDDQKMRPTPAPVEVKAGDEIRVTCTHDAGLRRQLPQLKTLPPRYVVWGDGTSDEMCIGLLLYSPAA
ncbi:hypothetical protein [Umezawaea sp. Da 62-37]|uniref:monooxygenase n=1 Tax=Umezawaea sp. Da 62-37 TaxID=3075927 RepID=UPI0028F717A6|nr:hypothetical protein [Umezawaea sp. Da 62-37]WNV85900.1 hypothetical protein RM788_48610 [Umezawaea sp. Da 62-37]